MEEEVLNVKDSLVWVKMLSEDMTEENCKVLTTRFKKEGARSVLITTKDYDIQVLSDEQLKNLGLTRIKKE
jgi:hypothetical protein